MKTIGRLRGRLPAWSPRAVAGLVIVAAILLPFTQPEANSFMNNCVLALAYVVMALGLNTVVGFAGLLDLGYVAFFAIGAYTTGWFSSGFYTNLHIHIGVSGYLTALPGIHLNWLLVVIAAAIICAIAGIVIGLPTLRLRGDYIAVVTLAFGEIIRVFAINGHSIIIPSWVPLFGGEPLTNGRQGITPIDQLQLPGLKPFDQLHLRPWYWTALGLALLVLFASLRLRDSRLGRAWVAIREDEVAAVSTGVPLVRTKLSSYAIGAAMGGMSGAFLGAFLNTVNAEQFTFSFSIYILAMIILGGLGSIWGVVLGAIALTFLNYYLIPDVFNSLPSTFGLGVNLTDLSYGIFGFILVLMMILRPEGLLPERRHQEELAEGIGETEAALVEERR
ncbi:MAG: branched-chain amino acid ABC transporter permease [Actinobacteria bacterium]|nr:branched-chain amino acid ABC transporter permease [Actinomycetota bacterium]